MTTPNSPLEEKILKAIHEHRVSMRPHWRYTLRAIGIIALLGIIAVYLLFHASFFFYALRQNGSLLLPGFGKNGISRLLNSFPWGILAIGLILMVILSALIGRRTRAYRLPFIYTILFVVGVASLVSLVIAWSPFHEKFSQMAVDDKLPIITPFYQQYATEEPQETFIGEITKIEDNQFTLIDRRGYYIQVVILKNTKTQPDFSVTNGESVIVIGDLHNGSVEAEEIHKLSAQFGQDVISQVQKKLEKERPIPHPEK
jgi:hypothetical protein